MPKVKEKPQPSTARRTELYNKLVKLQQDMMGTGADTSAAAKLENDYKRLKEEYDLYYDDEKVKV